MKHFSCPEEFYTELKAYQLKLPMLPNLLAFHPRSVIPAEAETQFRIAPPADTGAYWLKLERINGLPYLDLPSGFDAIKLAQTIASFHLATLTNGKCLCHIDNQPKNILASASGYYIIDFSDSRIDFPERDISHLLLFWASDFPETTFTALSTEFISSYTKLIPLSPSHWLQWLPESIAAFELRRQTHSKPSGKNPPQIKKANLDRLAGLIV